MIDGSVSLLARLIEALGGLVVGWAHAARGGGRWGAAVQQ